MNISTFFEFTSWLLQSGCRWIKFLNAGMDFVVGKLEVRKSAHKTPSLGASCLERSLLPY